MPSAKRRFLELGTATRAEPSISVGTDPLRAALLRYGKRHDGLPNIPHDQIAAHAAKLGVVL